MIAVYEKMKKKKKTLWEAKARGYYTDVQSTGKMISHDEMCPAKVYENIFFDSEASQIFHKRQLIKKVTRFRSIYIVWWAHHLSP